MLLHGRRVSKYNPLLIFIVYFLCELKVELVRDIHNTKVYAKFGDSTDKLFFRQTNPQKR